MKKIGIIIGYTYGKRASPIDETLFNPFPEVDISTFNLF
jgi:hypothetical protein